MNILGLKGFSNLGKIDQYFTSGCFPDKWDWTLDDVLYVVNIYNIYITRQNPGYRLSPAIGRTSNDKYILICYSDGGLIGHILGLLDPRCKGIIAHSATFPQKHVERAWKTQEHRDFFFHPSAQQKKPILIIQNGGELTKYLPSWYGRPKQAIDWYLDQGFPLEDHNLPKNTWHGHEFDNAFGIMASWAKRHFSMELPIR